MIDRLTFGQLLDLLDRAHTVIHESEGADEHAGILFDLKAASTLLRDEIGASHMGSGADEVVIERGDGLDEDEDEHDGEREACAACGESYNATESDAGDTDTYCSATCEAEETGAK